MSINTKDLQELHYNLKDLKKINEEINSFMKIRGGGYKNDKNSIEYFIEEKKKYKKQIIFFWIISIIILIYLFSNRANKYIIKNNLLGGFKGGTTTDNFTLIVRGNIYKTWDDLPKGKILFASIIFILIYVYLASKKITFPCFGCSKGAWWYKCSEGTGYNSFGCKIYTKIYDIVSVLVRLGFDAIEQVANLLEKAVYGLYDSKERILKMIKKITDTALILKPPNINIPQIRFNCPIGIGNASIDICSALAFIINKPMQGMKFIIEKKTYIMFKAFKVFWNALKVAGRLMLRATARAISVMMYPIHMLLSLIVDLKKTFEFIFYTIHKLGIINMILYNIASFVKTIFPIRNFGTLIAITFLVFLIFIIFPFIGGIAAGFRAINSIFNNSYDNAVAPPFNYLGRKMDEYEPESKIDKTYLNQPMSPITTPISPMPSSLSPIVSPSPVSTVDPVVSPDVSPSPVSTIDPVVSPVSNPSPVSTTKSSKEGLKKPEGMSFSEEVQWNIDQSKKDKLGTKQFFDRKEKEKQNNK